MKQFVYWSTQGVKDVFAQLHTTIQGLSSDEAQQRLTLYGPNHIDITIEGGWRILLRQLQSPFNYLLLMAALIEVIVGDYINGALICFLTCLNIVIGFYQEYKAHKTVLLLKRYIPSKTYVIRNGKEIQIAHELIVPGDIIVVQEGNTIPADARFVQGALQVDESTLTGESLPVEKVTKAISSSSEIFQATNILFAGTTVTQGKGLAVVLATGNATVFYTITSSIHTTTKISSYEKGLIDLSRITLYFVIITMAAIFIVKQFTYSPIHFIDELIFFITLIIAIVPEALPAVVAFSLAQGALKLAKNHVVVKRLTAMNDLGNVEILCTDKTGTITELHLAVDSIESPDPELCHTFLILDNFNQSQSTQTKSPFDTVLLEYASASIKNAAKKYTILAKIPFDSSRMRTTLLVKDSSNKIFLISRGAPDILLQLSESTTNGLSLEELYKKVKDFGEQGKRALAIAYKQVNTEKLTPELENDLQFLGFAVLTNPIKHDVHKTVKLAKELGVALKMITGDSKEVASYVGKHIGLVDQEHNVITGSELTKLSPEEFKKECIHCSIFARIDPVTKARIIESLQESYEVGFMGEGINDVPALKKANVGIVVQEASDVARAVSDIVLLKRDLHVVVAGIKQGRTTFSNINKYIKCTLAGNFGNYYSLALFSLLVPFLPMLPTQILLINVLSDFPLIAIASDLVPFSEIRRPKNYNLYALLPLTFLLGLVGTLSDIIFFSMFYTTTPDMFRTLWFVLNIVSDVVLIYSVRTTHAFYKAPRPSGLLALASCISLIICFILPYSSIGHAWLSFEPPAFIDLMYVLAIVLLYGIMTELVKLSYYRYARNTR